MTYTYDTKLMVCTRLGSSWSDLSDVLGIKPHERSRFPQGFEAQAIWDWLEERRRLDELPTALVAAGRPDLARELTRHSTALGGTEALPQVRGTAPSFTYFSLIEPAEERAFYDHLAQCIENAEEAVYRTGHGFHHERSSKYYGKLIRAEEQALKHQVEIIRIQTGSHVAAGWAEGYARLLERFEGHFTIKADFEYNMFSDVGLLDPHGHDPVVYFLIETRLPSSSGTETRPAGAVFIRHNQHLAAELGRQFVVRAQTLRDLSPQDVRDLSKTYVYFAWGVHMASHKMYSDVPGARLRGTAILRGWIRNFSAMLAGPANRSTITQTNNASDMFDGVAYELSWWAKTQLDLAEGRSYQPIEVTVEIKGVETPAFTYLPLPPSTRNRGMSRNSWVGLVIEGAREHNVSGLVNELRKAGYEV